MKCSELCAAAVRLMQPEECRQIISSLNIFMKNLLNKGGTRDKQF